MVTSAAVAAENA